MRREQECREKARMQGTLIFKKRRSGRWEENQKRVVLLWQREVDTAVQC